MYKLPVLWRKHSFFYIALFIHHTSHMNYTFFPNVCACTNNLVCCFTRVVYISCAVKKLRWHTQYVNLAPKFLHVLTYLRLSTEQLWFPYHPTCSCRNGKIIKTRVPFSLFSCTSNPNFSTTPWVTPCTRNVRCRTRSSSRRSYKVGFTRGCI